MLYMEGLVPPQISTAAAIGAGPPPTKHESICTKSAAGSLLQLADPHDGNVHPSTLTLKETQCRCCDRVGLFRALLRLRASRGLFGCLSCVLHLAVFACVKRDVDVP